MSSLIGDVIQRKIAKLAKLGVISSSLFLSHVQEVHATTPPPGLEASHTPGIEAPQEARKETAKERSRKWWMKNGHQGHVNKARAQTKPCSAPSSVETKREVPSNALASRTSSAQQQRQGTPNNQPVQVQSAPRLEGGQLSSIANGIRVTDWSTTTNDSRPVMAPQSGKWCQSPPPTASPYSDPSFLPSMEASLSNAFRLSHAPEVHASQEYEVKEPNAQAKGEANTELEMQLPKPREIDPDGIKPQRRVVSLPTGLLHTQGSSTSSAPLASYPTYSLSNLQAPSHYALMKNNGHALETMSACDVQNSHFVNAVERLCGAAQYADTNQDVIATRDLALSVVDQTAKILSIASSKEQHLTDLLNSAIEALGQKQCENNLLKERLVACENQLSHPQHQNTERDVPIQLAQLLKNEGQNDNVMNSQAYKELKSMFVDKRDENKKNEDLLRKTKNEQKKVVDVLSQFLIQPRLNEDLRTDLVKSLKDVGITLKNVESETSNEAYATTKKEPRSKAANVIMPMDEGLASKPLFIHLRGNANQLFDPHYCGLKAFLDVMRGLLETWRESPKDGVIEALKRILEWNLGQYPPPHLPLNQRLSPEEQECFSRYQNLCKEGERLMEYVRMVSSRVASLEKMSLSASRKPERSAV